MSALPHAPVWKNMDQPRRLPGPRVWPLIGALPSVGSTRNFYKAMVRWLDQYGDPYEVQLGPFRYIFTANAALARTILESRPEGARRPEMTRIAFASIDAADMLFSAEGRMWKTHRKAIAKSLGAHNLTVAEDMINDEVQRQLQRLEQALCASTGQPIDFLPFAKHYSVTIISKLVFGGDFRNISTDDRVIDDIAVIFSTLARRISFPFPYWKFFKLPSDRRYERVKRELNRDVLQAIEAARAKLATLPPGTRAENLLEGMLMDGGGTSGNNTANINANINTSNSRPDNGKEYAQANGTVETDERLTDKEVIDNCIGLIAAGLDTTSTTLSWAVFLLGKHPAMQQRLLDELNAATDGTGQLKTLQGISTLPLLEAVIWEALRLHPAAPFLPAHTLRDFDFEGQRIPAGSNFFFLLSESERRSADYDPTFNPDRWFADGMLARAIKQMPLPFGTGQRLCPGRNLSVMEMKAMLAALVHRYAWTVPAGFEPDCHFNFTIDPDRIPVSFVARSHA